MTTLSIPKTKVVTPLAERAVCVNDYAPRADRYVDRIDPTSVPRDCIGREITVLLHLHPRLTQEFGPIELSSLSTSEKELLLVRLKSTLKIPAFSRRHLGYVGP